MLLERERHRRARAVDQLRGHEQVIVLQAVVAGRRALRLLARISRDDPDLVARTEGEAGVELSKGAQALSAPGRDRATRGRERLLARVLDDEPFLVERVRRGRRVDF